MDAISDPALAALRTAFEADDAATVRAILDRQPALRAKIDEPIGPFDSPAILHVRSRAMLDALLDAGADVDARSRWWAGGFGLLDSADPELATYAVERGATVTVHAAARLGWMDDLRRRIGTEASLVHARGGDGKTPLHFAGTVEVAAYLLEQDADIDALDVDHESTPAQHMLDDRVEVARLLVARGCRTDLLMAAALGDVELARRHLDAEPGSIRLRVDGECFPMKDPRAGGTIYQWTLGFHATPHQVARRRGHREILELLLERSPPEVALLDACWDGDDERARALRARHPGLVAGLAPADRRQVAHAARNHDATAVRLMLEHGWPADATGQHGATPLHWAAFHGHRAMAEEILRHDPPLEVNDADFASTPLGWAIHGSEHGWHCRTGDYAGTVEALLRAGAKPPEEPAGSAAVRAVLGRAGGEG
ncbi:MAG TPA: ankyrin repeat domain-containing protein [Thermoanaerobaculia bacterium]|nr:ankyrin repeat domain-containing protein [Thermoanaerobaculia bacterium]